VVGGSDVLDEALEVLSDRAPDFENGNTNHAPMVAETLVKLGYGEQVPGWIDAYRRDVPVRPGERPALRGDWAQALGRLDEWPAWVSLFRRELAEAPWTQVLDVWSGRLAAGLSGEATHGLIRTAHAARGLEAAVTPPRLNELADALAYWAASYHAFPSRVSMAGRGLPLDAALESVPRLDPDRSGNIDQTLRRLDDMPEAAGLIDLLAFGEDPLADLSALTARFAGVYLANAASPRLVFAVVHAVTGPSAVRLLAPHISTSNTRLLLRHAWEAAAAMYAVYGRERDFAGSEPETTDTQVLIEASVENGATHAIKFVEACLREYAVSPQPVYLAAAADASWRVSS
jgi:hypothetical protein